MGVADTQADRAALEVRREAEAARERQVQRVADALMRCSMQHAGFAPARRLAEAAVDAMDGKAPRP